MVKTLLTEQNYKTTKGESFGYLTGILYMAPADMVAGINVCKFASAGCKKACLFSAGRGVMRPVIQARVRKTELFRDDLNAFMAILGKDIARIVRKAQKLNLRPCIRLNGTSDISWENVRDTNGKNIFELFPDVQFYDYTKNFTRDFLNMPSNYHLTLSRSESNEKRVINKPVNVAVVFKDELPATYGGRKVINGDMHDLRFLDESNTIVGLTAKGKAKKDLSGFVV